jgi:hypothetical protein
MPLLFFDASLVAVGMPAFGLSPLFYSGAAVIYREGEEHTARSRLQCMFHRVLQSSCTPVLCAVAGWNATPSWASFNLTQPYLSPTSLNHSYIELISPRPAHTGYFGHAVSISGDGSTLAIGSHGANWRVSAVTLTMALSGQRLPLGAMRTPTSSGPLHLSTASSFTHYCHRLPPVALSSCTRTRAESRPGCCDRTSVSMRQASTLVSETCSFLKRGWACLATYAIGC